MVCFEILSREQGQGLHFVGQNGLGPVSDLSGSARGSAGLVQLAWFARGDGARSCCGVGRPCSTGGFSGAGLALQKEHALGHTHNKVGVRV